MGDSKYQLRYLPIFFDDVDKTISYIRSDLSNPLAANKLLDLIESSILKRLPNCESFEKFQSNKQREYPYYRIYVNNYVIYYVVIGDKNKIMEVRRFLHKRQNRNTII